VIASADSIVAISKNDTDQINALLWKIQATSAVNTAAYQTIPSLALVDTWILSRQMNEYFNRNGSVLFSDQAPIAQDMAANAELEMRTLAQSLFSENEFNQAETFVNNYADSVKFHALNFQRKSLLKQWNTHFGIPDSATIETVGSLPQVFADASERMTVLGEQVPNTTRWQLDIFQRQLTNDTIETLHQIENVSLAMQKLVTLLEDPTMLDSAMLLIKTEITPMLLETQLQWDRTLGVIGEERSALTDSLRAQSQDLVADLDELSIKMIDHTIERTFAQIPDILGSVALLLIVVMLVLFGLPFGLGILVGRLWKRKKG
jgi:hypothetical protein